MLASDNHLDRRAEVWHVLIAREWESSPSWEQLFDDLTPERTARLGELYDVLPAGARAEYDRRYGAPPGAGVRPGHEEGIPGTPPAETALWRNARTLADLAELTAQFIEGRLSQSPGHWGPPDSETTDLIPLLAAVNRAGFVTCISQSGEQPQKPTSSSVQPAPVTPT